MHGMSKRSVFVVAPDGTIRYKWVTDDPTFAPLVEQVLDSLRELRLARS
jgi:peroxiredoxin